MQGSVTKAIDYVLALEGGLVNNAQDSGRMTNFGISLRFLMSTGLRYDFLKQGVINAHSIEMLSEENARTIYQEQFWLKAYDAIQSDRLAIYTFDCSVNCGASTACILLQRATWAIEGMKGGLVADGQLGPITLATVNKCGEALLAPFRAERAGYYRMLSTDNLKSRVFLQGWLNRAYHELP